MRVRVMKIRTALVLAMAFMGFGCSDPIHEEGSDDLCPVMDPVRLKFGETEFVYPAIYYLRVDFGANGIQAKRRSSPKNSQLQPGDAGYGLYGGKVFCDLPDGEFLEPIAVGFYENVSRHVEENSDFTFPDQVRTFGIIGPKIRVPENPVYNYMDLTGTVFDHGRCSVNYKIPATTCSLYKKIKGTDVYLRATFEKRAIFSSKIFRIWDRQYGYSETMLELEAFVLEHIENQGVD